MNQSLSFIMLLRAFSSGAVALSGVEAISNGVPAVQEARVPQRGEDARSRWARSSARASSGVSILAAHLQPYRGEQDPTGIALMADWIYNGKGFLFWATQMATFAILILAANTAYADFPRLRRSSRGTGSFPASSPTAATGSCSRTGSSSSPSWPAS